jgi:hypothetical protein
MKRLIICAAVAALWSPLAFAQTNGWTENTAASPHITTTTDNVGIGATTAPLSAPLSFGAGFGPKIDFYPLSTSLYGIGLFTEAGTGITYVGTYSNTNYPSGVALGTFNGSVYVPVVFANNAGKVGIGANMTHPAVALDVSGDIRASGSITGGTVIGAVWQDVAEWVPAAEKMAPGTVVVLNRNRNNEVTQSRRAYDTAVAGVVSAHPGVILGIASESKAQIATTGRVRIKADATGHPIQVGDLLVTSDTPGMAMKSIPVDLGGVEIHRPGTLIGKALEPLPSGEGEILVLLSLQ